MDSHSESSGGRGLIATASNDLVKGIYTYSLADRTTGLQSLALLSTPDASTRVQRLAILFIKQNTEGQWEGVVAAPQEIIEELLNAG